MDDELNPKWIFITIVLIAVVGMSATAISDYYKHQERMKLIEQGHIKSMEPNGVQLKFHWENKDGKSDKQ